METKRPPSNIFWTPLNMLIKKNPMRISDLMEMSNGSKWARPTGNRSSSPF